MFHSKGSCWIRVRSSSIYSATLVGEALAQTQVTLIGNTITAPIITPPYSVTFAETGIPTTGVTWGVTVGGTDHTGTGSNITVTGITEIQPYSFDTAVTGATGVRYVSDCPELVSGAGTQSCGYTTQYQVSFAVSPPGSGADSPSTTTYYNAGMALSISATANSGYDFSGWSNGETSIAFTSLASSTTTATISGPGTITAYFSTAGVPSPSLSNACVSYPVYDYFVGTTLVGTGTHATYSGPNVQLIAGGPVYGGSNVLAMFDPSLSCLTGP